MARRYDEALKPLDLNNGQFSMLTVIAGFQPVGVSFLGDRLGMDRTTVTAALKPLERRGLVDVVVPDDDARGRDVSLTRQGIELLSRAMPLWRRAQNALAATLPPDDATVLRRHLSALA